MAKVKFGKNGQLINAETGQVISRSVNGKFQIGSQGAQLKTLQQMGVKQPQIPEEKDEQEQKKEEDTNSQWKFEDQKTEPSKPISVKKPSYSKNRTKYQVTPDSYFQIDFGLQMQDDGRFIPIKSQYVDDFKNSQFHWVRFRMWTFSEELQWKQKSTSYNSSLKSLNLDNNKLNELKIKHLMLDWSFGEYEDSLKLLHCDGVLSDESYNLFMGLYPSIANTIINLMNNVLENNQ